MKSKYKKILFLACLLAAVFSLPVLALAQSSQVGQGLQSSGIGSLFGFGGLNSSQTAGQLLVNVIRLILQFVAVIAVLFIIIGGFWYVTSGGNEETAEKGKKTLINAIIGLVIIMLSYVIVTVVVNTLTRTSIGWF